MKIRAFVATILLCMAVIGCNKSDQHPGDVASPRTGHHHHSAPHGGSLVELGQHAAHLEVVFQPSTGQMDIYVWDAHVENPIRLQTGKALALELSDPSELKVSLEPVADPLSGETRENTSHFSVTVQELEGVASFRGRVPEISVQGTTYQDVLIEYPSSHSH